MDQLDLRGIPCPQNAAKAVIRIATMDEGESLAILVDDGEPVQNVAASLTTEGHEVLERSRESAGHWRLVVGVGG